MINHAVSATAVVAVISAIYLVASSTGLMMLGAAQWRARPDLVFLRFCSASPERSTCFRPEMAWR